MRHPFVVACALVVLGASLSGCARGDQPGPVRTFEPERTASSPSPKATAEDRDVCKLLTAKERKSIAGVRIDVVTPAADPSQCRWVKSLKVPFSSSITVLTSSAQAWVRRLPALIDSTIAEGLADDKDIKRLVAAKKLVAKGADKIGDREACGLFALLVEAYRGEKAIRTMVTFQASGESPSALAQTCTRGRYTALAYAERDLYPSRALNAAVLRVLDYAHERAIKRASE
jgi:hypothetical protein